MSVVELNIFGAGEDLKELQLREDSSYSLPRMSISLTETIEPLDSDSQRKIKSLEVSVSERDADYIIAFLQEWKRRHAANREVKS